MSRRRGATQSRPLHSPRLVATIMVHVPNRRVSLETLYNASCVCRQTRPMLRPRLVSIRIVAVLLLGSIFAGHGCGPTISRPTTPSNYRVYVPAASQTRLGQALTLTVRVTDANGIPVEDVPVHFHLPATWTTVAEVTPPTVVTRHGQASATFRARRADRMTVRIGVEDFSALVDVVVLGDTPRF